MIIRAVNGTETIIAPMTLRLARKRGQKKSVWKNTTESKGSEVHILKYHKIKNVPLEVCTAEQKVAYNIAFAVHINYQDKYDKAKAISSICADDVVRDIILMEVQNFKKGMEEGLYKGHFDIDAIQACLNAGLVDYLDHFFIAWEYEQIGKAFPAHYLKGA